MQLRQDVLTCSMYKKETVINSVSWSVLTKVVRQALQLFMIFLLSRILGPAEFGLMSMVTSFSMLAEIVRNMGTGAAIIQNKSITDDILDTAFCFNVVTGLFLFMLFFIGAPLIADFFRQRELTSLIRVFASVYIIGSLNIVQEALLQKNMEFKRLFYMDLISVIVSGAVAILMAMNGWGVWSLVFQYIVMITCSTIVLWYTSAWKPSLRFKSNTFQQISRYSLSLFIHDVVYFFGRDTDKFLIGRWLGAATLGIYYRAYMLMLLPVNQINTVITKVMFPALSVLQDDPEAMRKLYLKATHFISFISFPSLCLLFISAEPLIQLLLGSKWLGVVNYLRIFCLYGMLESISTTIFWLYKTTGRTDKMLRWGVISTILIIASFISGLWYNGAMGVAMFYVIMQFLLWIPGWRMAFRLIDLKLADMLKNIGPNFLNSLLAVPLPWWMMERMRYKIPDILLIVALCLIYVAVYFICSFLSRQQGYFFIVRFFRGRLLRQAVQQ